MKIGILGVGGISRGVAPTLQWLEEVECYAVASRSLEKAQEFAATFGFQKAYGSYEELAKDPDVELVYVCTPHSHHFENMMLCIANGKAVICEKAFTMNATQAKKIRDFAREKGVFAAEAIWPRYMPSRKVIQDVIDSGRIGNVNIMTANLSYIIHKVPRITDPNLAGGALLDVGVYGVNFALTHFGGDVDRVETAVQFTPTGVDGMETITLFYKNGRMAVLTHGIYSRSDRKSIIYGDKGYLIIENINNPESISIYDDSDHLLETIEFPQDFSGYEYEFREAIRCIREGKIEADSMPLDHSVEMMELMDTVRAKWGLVYPQEREEA